MRRASVLAALALALMFVLAAPAAAHKTGAGLRDPFQPLVSADTGGGGVAPAPGAGPVVLPQPVTPPEGLPVTGSSIDTWLGIAYGLVALGAGAIVLSRSRAPARGIRA